MQPAPPRPGTVCATDGDPGGPPGSGSEVQPDHAPAGQPDGAPALPLPVVLITRPRTAALRFAAQIAGLGLPTVIAPLMRIVPLAHDRAAVAAARGLVFTSENAVPYAGQGRGRPAICVGPRTAAAARAAGFAVREGGGDAARLMPMLSGLGPGWLHLRGAHAAAELPVPAIAVYDQQAAPLDGQAAAVLAGPAPVILPLFSPRSAALAARATAGAGAAPLWTAFISAAAAAAWDLALPPAAVPPAQRATAPHPNAASMCDTLARMVGAA